MTTTAEQHPLVVTHRAWLTLRPAVFRTSRFAEKLRELYRDERSRPARTVTEAPPKAA